MFMDIELFAQGQNETDEQFYQRKCKAVDRSFLYITKREKNESAEQHFKRFQDYEFSKNGDFLCMPRYGEDINDPIFKRRKGIFLNTRRIILEQWDEDIFNSLKRNNEKEPLSIWLSRVDEIIAKHFDQINDIRVELSETNKTRMARVNKFNNFRSDIQAQILFQPLDEELRSDEVKTKMREQAKEDAREEARQERFSKIKAVEKKEKEDIEDAIKYKMFIFYCVISFCLFWVNIPIEYLGVPLAVILGYMAYKTNIFVNTKNRKIIYGFKLFIGIVVIFILIIPFILTIKFSYATLGYGFISLIILWWMNQEFKIKIVNHWLYLIPVNITLTSINLIKSLR